MARDELARSMKTSAGARRRPRNQVRSIYDVTSPIVAISRSVCRFVNCTVFELIDRFLVDFLYARLTSDMLCLCAVGKPGHTGGNTRYFADFSDFCQILPQKSW